MTEVMTDKQLAFIINLIADKVKSCETIEEAKKAVDDLADMMKKGKDKRKDD